MQSSARWRARARARPSSPASPQPPSDWQRLRHQFTAKDEEHEDDGRPLVDREFDQSRWRNEGDRDADRSQMLRKWDTIHETSDLYARTLASFQEDHGFGLGSHRPSMQQAQPDPQLRAQVEGVLDRLRQTELRVETATSHAPNATRGSDEPDDDEDFRDSLLARRARLLMQQHQAQEHGGEYSTWVKRIEQRFEAAQNHSKPAGALRHRRPDSPEGRPARGDHSLYNSSGRYAFEERGRHPQNENQTSGLNLNASRPLSKTNQEDFLKPVPRISIRNPRPASPSTASMASARVQGAKGPQSLLFSWETERFPRARDEMREQEIRMPARPRKASVEVRRPQTRELTRAQKKGILRLEARRELRLMRNTFGRVLLYADRLRTAREESQALILARYRARKQTKRLQHAFQCFAVHAARATDLRKRAMLRRFVLRWAAFAAEQHERRLEERREYARKEQTRILVNQALLHNRGRVLRKSWAALVAHMKRRQAHRAEVELEKARREQMRRFKEHLRREQSEGAQPQHLRDRSQQERSARGAPSSTPKLQKRPQADVAKHTRKPRAPAPPVPPEVAAMQARALERKERRDELRKRQNELELMRAEEVAQRAFEDNMRVLHERAQELARKRQAQAKREQEQKVREGYVKLSTLHSERATLWYHGLKPWKLLVRLAKVNETRALRHHDTLAMRRTLRHWRGVVKSIALVRRKKHKAMDNAAKHFRRRSLLRLGWRLIAERHFRLQSKCAAIRSCHRLLVLQQACRTWQVALRREEARADYARRFASRTLVRRAWAAWEAHLEAARQARARAAGKNQIWSKVRSWLQEDDHLLR